MAEYIEREAVLEFVEPDARPFLAERIKSIPAADVRPVVLCKDCVHSDKWYADRLICYLWNEHDGNSVFEDGFCNYGVKREASE